MLRSPAALAFLALVLPLEASANTCGQCAQERDLELKIAACTDASKSTSDPSILRWVYRELAAHTGSVARSSRLLPLTCDRSLLGRTKVVRREMEELAHASGAMPGTGLAGLTKAQHVVAINPAGVIDINALTLESHITVFMARIVPDQVLAKLVSFVSFGAFAWRARIDKLSHPAGRK